MYIISMDSSDDTNLQDSATKETKSAQKRRKKKNRRKEKRRHKDKNQSSADGDDTCNSQQTNENEQENATTDKTPKRSRSNSVKRLRNLFRRSTDGSDKSPRSPEVNATNEFTFDVSHAKGSNPEESGKDQGSQNLDGVLDLDPILKPRARLRFMTVRDAMKERQRILSPGRYDPRTLEERGKELSSSLPDLNEQSDSQIQATDSNNRKPKRSKSSDATLRRRQKRKVIYGRSPKESDSADVYLVKDENSALQSVKETAIITDDAVETFTAIPSTDITARAFGKSDLQTKQPSANTEVSQHLPSSTHDENQENENHKDSSKSTDDIQSFVNMESSRRESFSKFLLLSRTLPSYSTSSLARARSRDQSPNSLLGTQSRDQSPVRSRISMNAINEGIAVQNTLTLPRSKKGNEETSFMCQIPDTNEQCLDNSLSLHEKNANISKWLHGSKPVDLNVATVSSGNNFAFAAPNSTSSDAKLSLTDENISPVVNTNTPIHVPRMVNRSEYKSPRRFSGRSISGERKSKSRRKSEQLKENDTKVFEETSAKDNDTDPSKTQNLCETDQIKLKPEPHITMRKSSCEIQTILVNENEKQTKNDGHISKENETTKMEKHAFTKKDIEKPPELLTTRSVQTSVQNLHDLLSNSVETHTQPLHPHIEISEIAPRNSFSNEEIDTADQKSSLLPRRASNKVSEASDPTASDIEEVTSFLTPESSPKPSKKFSTLLSTSNKSKLDYDERQIPSCSSSNEISRENSKKSSTVEDTIEEFYDARDDVAIQPKSKAKLSILAIVALKRKLARQRKKKSNEQSRKPQEEKSKAKDKNADSKRKDNEENKNTVGLYNKSKVEHDTDIYIENETNRSISKLNKLQDQDIIEKLIGQEDEIIPISKKKIRFDPEDEPLASDEPLDDAILQQRQKTDANARRRGSKIRERQKKALNCCKKFVAFLFSHIGLSSLVVAYSILGGIIFQALEGRNEIEVRVRVLEKRQATIDSIYKLSTEMQLNKRGSEEFRQKVKKLLSDFQTEVFDATSKSGWKNEDDSDPNDIKVEKQWSFASSLLFAITVMTTIGYGHVAPKTDYGRIVTILYAVLGIPLTLLCLTNIGDLMATGFRLLYGKVCCGVCCLLFSPRRKRIPDPEKGLIDSGGEIVLQTKDKSSSGTIHVPTSVCILLMTSYVMLGTLLFCLWEGWDVVTGTYFSFITLSTIGFGDVVPGMASADWAVKEKLVLCALYLVFGLSLIAMCFNLVQEDVKAKFRWLGSKIGLFDKNKR